MPTDLSVVESTGKGKKCKTKGKPKGGGKGDETNSQASSRQPNVKPTDQDVECFYCPKRGHVKADCRKKQADDQKKAAETGLEGDTP